MALEDAAGVVRIPQIDLWNAARTGDVATLRALIDSGDVVLNDEYSQHDYFTGNVRFGVGTPYDFGYPVTPLGAAAFYGHAQCVRILLDAGAEAGGRRGEYIPALTAAVGGGKETIISILLAHDHDLLEEFVDMTFVVEDDVDMTALNFAIECASDGIVKILVNAGADVFGGGYDLDYPCFYSAFELGRRSVCKMLLRGKGRHIDDKFMKDPRSRIEICPLQNPYYGTYYTRDRARQPAEIEECFVLVEDIERAGGWPEYVNQHRHLVTTFIAKLGPMPNDVACSIAQFIWPPGGY